MLHGRTATSPAVVAEVRRERVLRRLGSDQPSVVVISAPAGSGKSIVAAQWMAGDDRRHATLRLATYLDDAVPLIGAVVQALEPLGRPAPHTRARITAKEPAFSATQLPALAQLVSTREPFAFVIDDAHLVQSEQGQLVLKVVCEAVPPGSTVVLLTRSQTPEWLARLRTTGRLLELNGNDLAFDQAETAGLLTGLGVVAGPVDVRAIVEHTEGWPVGVYLTALALRDNEASPALARRLPQGNDRAISDYLRTQVLDALADSERQFLTRTSIVEDLDGPLCDAVLDRTDSGAVLAALHRRVQLMILTDPDVPRYRVHHLLGEELLSDLQTLEPTVVSGLHARAAVWFEAHQDHDAAIRHATASGDATLATRMIWPRVPSCVASGHLDSLGAWLAGLSDEQIAEQSWLTMAAAWRSLQQGDGESMRRWVATAQGHAGNDWRDAAERDPYAATLAILLALVGNDGIDGTRDLCARALLGLAPDDPFRAAAAFNFGVALVLQGDRAAGVSALHDAQVLGSSLHVPVIEANALSMLGVLALDSGSRQEGIQLVSQAAQISHDHRLDRLVTGSLSMTAEAFVLALVGDKAAAATALATARRLTSLAAGIGPWFAVWGRVLQARAAILVGDGATARVLLTEARDHLTADLAATSLADALTGAETELSRLSDHGGAAGVLTATELRVLQFLPSYLTLRQIGEHLFVSQATVKTHVLSIYRKFGVSTRADAVEHARALGLVESPITD